MGKKIKNLTKLITLIFLLLFQTILLSKEFDQEKSYKKIIKNLTYIDKNQKNLYKGTRKILKMEKEFSEIIENFDKIIKTDSEFQQLEANTRIFSIYNRVDSKTYLKDFEVYSNFLNKYDILKIYDNNLLLINSLLEKEFKKQNFSKINEYISYFDYMYNSINNNITEKAYSENLQMYINLREKIKNEKENVANLYVNKLVDDAKNKIKNNNLKKYEYRKIYRTLLDIKKYNSNNEELLKLLNISKEKGFFKFNIVSNKAYTDIIKNNLKNIGIENNLDSEITIIYNDNIVSNLNPPIIVEKDLVHKESIGYNTDGSPIYKLYNYKKITTTVTKEIKINYQLSINSSFYNNSINDYVSQKYTSTHTQYIGNVPWFTGIKNSDSNSKNNNEIIDDLKYKISNKINSFMKQIEKDLSSF